MDVWTKRYDPMAIDECETYQRGVSMQAGVYYSDDRCLEHEHPFQYLNVRETGSWIYQRCTVCGLRRVIHVWPLLNGEHMNYDFDRTWLKVGLWSQVQDRKIDEIGVNLRLARARSLRRAA